MANLLRVSLQGTFPNSEEWSVNPVWNISDFGVATTPAQIQAVAVAVANVTMPVAALATWATGTVLASVRVEARTYTGSLENQAEAVKTIPAAGQATVPHSFQTAIVQSLRSNQVGPRGRGRLYWPATGLSLAIATYRPTSAAVGNLLTAYTSYLGLCQAAIRTTFAAANLAVWSRVQHAGFNVVSTQIGDVLDVQRRRRDTLVEAYQSVAFP